MDRGEEYLVCRKWVAWDPVHGGDQVDIANLVLLQPKPVRRLLCMETVPRLCVQALILLLKMEHHHRDGRGYTKHHHRRVDRDRHVTRASCLPDKSKIGVDHLSHSGGLLHPQPKASTAWCPPILPFHFQPATLTSAVNPDDLLPHL